MLVKCMLLLPITLLVISTAASQDLCHFTVKVTQELLNNGFHRNLTYKITFEWGNEEEGEVMWYYDGCVLGMQQVLPAGVFVNPDELMDFRRSGKLTAFPNHKIDIELPALFAHPTRAYVFSSVLHSAVNTWLPLHARYHRAVAGGGYAENVIGPPSIFLRCADTRLEVCSMPLTTKTYLCSNQSEKCLWKEPTPTMMNKVVVWKVPVGDRNHHSLVTFLTIISLAVGTVVLLKSIHEHKMAYRHRRL